MGRKVLGLEVTPRTVKIALVQNGYHPELQSCSIFNISANIGGNTLSDDEKDLSTIALAIKETTAKNKLLSRGVDSVALCVNNPQTVVRPISLPVLPDAELNAAVEFELSQSFPGLGKTHVISFKEYSRSKDKIFGIVSFSPRKSLEPYRRLLEILEYKRSYIDVMANSEAKAYASFVGPAKSDRVCFLCDIDSSSTQFTILKRREVLHSRQITEGVGSLKEIFRDTMGIKASEYEQLALEDLQAMDIPESELSAISRAAYSPIVEQLQQTIEFYNQDSGGLSPVAEVLLIGGGSIFPKLDDYFSSALGIPAAQVSPLNNVRADRITFVRSFSAIGAAVRED